MFSRIKKWIAKKPTKRFGILVGALLVIIFLIRASTFISSLLFEWFLIFALAAGLYFGAKMMLKKIGRGKLETKVLAAKNVVLSRREMEILSAIAKGHSNKEIGDDIFVSENTVKKHVSGVLDKLDAKRRTEAVKIAREAGLIR